MTNIDKFKAVSKVINEYDLNQLQFDTLWDLIDDNPLLPSSPSPALNKSLKTNKKNVIGAINELLGLIESTKTDVNNFDRLVKQTIGDISDEDAQEWEELLKIDRNVVCAIIKIWQELGGSSNVDISHLGGNIKDALFSLNDRITSHEVRIRALENLLSSELDKKEEFIRETPVQDKFSPEILRLTSIPNDRDVILSVNGIEYDEGDEFIVFRNDKTIKWIDDTFMLDFYEDEIDVCYYKNL